jgi:hypothetical protein
MPALDAPRALAPTNTPPPRDTLGIHAGNPVSSFAPLTNETTTSPLPKTSNPVLKKNANKFQVAADSAPGTTAARIRTAPSLRTLTGAGSGDRRASSGVFRGAKRTIPNSPAAINSTVSSRWKINVAKEATPATLQATRSRLSVLSPRFQHALKISESPYLQAFSLLRAGNYRLSRCP